MANTSGHTLTATIATICLLCLNAANRELYIRSGSTVMKFMLPLNSESARPTVSTHSCEFGKAIERRARSFAQVDPCPVGMTTGGAFDAACHGNHLQKSVANSATVAPA